MISYIHKLLLADVEPTSIELKVVQVGAMPMALPANIRLVQLPGGNLLLTWRWLPGEEEHELEFKRSANLGPCTSTVLRRLAETKPWKVNVA